MTVRPASDLAPNCDHEAGCITCGDVAVPMVVVEVHRERGLARCASDDGAEELVETSLLAPVRPGERLLVHAATALQRLSEEAIG